MRFYIVIMLGILLMAQAARADEAAVANGNLERTLYSVMERMDTDQAQLDKKLRMLKQQQNAKARAARAEETAKKRALETQRAQTEQSMPYYLRTIPQ